MPGAKVLVIDDDPDFRASLRSLLESEGYEVAEAGSSKEGLRKVAEFRPDLITVDVMMACDTDGYGVPQAIRYRDEYRDFRSIPLIMISAIDLSPDELFPMAPELEMIRPDFYLTKPLDLGRFLETVEHATAAHAPR